MNPPALTISLIVREPGEEWEFLAQVRGRPVSRGEGYASPADAFAEAVAQLREQMKLAIEKRERPN
ncbi:MAG: hypothetical protein IT511_00275 [Rhodocyclaceae bacterium]|nr:hypothetical protein [Rhodocyclaceae bacterium]